MTKSALAKKISETCRLTGRFTLRSGRTSSEYFDKYRFEADPRLLKAVSLLMAPLIPKETDILAGLEMGGVPLTAALSLQTELPGRFVRKQAKPYGTKQVCEGGDIQGRTLCLIEDVVTTGGQALSSAEALRACGAQINTVLCVIFRGERADLLSFKEKNLNLISLFTKKDLS